MCMTVKHPDDGGACGSWEEVTARSVFLELFEVRVAESGCGDLIFGNMQVRSDTVQLVQ